ncbi:MAG: hypothetical protein MHM6MM_000530 [Cercozoa sp. M6MM]
MSRRYDSKTTTFSQDGRIYQVEYAMQAINEGKPVIGIVASDGVILAGEKMTTSKLLDDQTIADKLFRVADHCAVGIAGITSDARVLLEYAQRVALQHEFRFQESVPVEKIISVVGDYKQSYTQHGSRRPFGVSFVLAGYDSHYGFQLYQSDPSGNYGGWKATAIGRNCQQAMNILKTDYDVEEQPTLQQAQFLALKCLSKTMDTVSPTAEKVQMGVLKLVEGRPTWRTLVADEVAKLIEDSKAQLEAEAEQAPAA